VANTATNVWAVILGVSVSAMPRTPSVRSLFLAWVCFSIAFNTVFQAFLTTFLVDSGYKTPIQSMDELFSSGMKLAYESGISYRFEYGDETEVSTVRRMKADCPSIIVCLEWALGEQNVSVLVMDIFGKVLTTSLSLLRKGNKHLLCRIDDGLSYNSESVMLMLYGDPLLKRVNEIIDRVMEAGLYNYWLSQFEDQYEAFFRYSNISIQLEEYYNFNLYHMQPAFHLLLMGLCLSVFCFVIEVIFNRLLNKRK
jgi:hypothetical protein